MNVKTDLERYSVRMSSTGSEDVAGQDTNSQSDMSRSTLRWLGFPFASVSVLVILVTLFLMSMERGGWSWSSWTYAFSFAIMVPLIIFEMKRKAVITGGAIIMLFFMVLIDAGASVTQRGRLASSSQVFRKHLIAPAHDLFVERGDVVLTEQPSGDLARFRKHAIRECSFHGKLAPVPEM